MPKRKPPQHLTTPQMEQLLASFEGRLKCAHGLKCCLHEAQIRCRARKKQGAVAYLECIEKQPTDCRLAVQIKGKSTYICNCPLRAYLYDHLERKS